ncbi:MAG TPA: saccharopine dehydrogenase NADP-binding domain-containing protein [Solirubrobacteraceae bacterium]
MAGRIVLFGATGYTGDLAARALVARGARPVLAARNGARVQALAEELGGLEWTLADVSRPQSVRALVGRGDVLVSTVGPFTPWGEPAVQAAVGAGAHYLDSTGEPAFIRAVFDRHGGAAHQAGCSLLTAFGYDWVPGNLAGALALREAGAAATRVEVGYFSPGAGESSLSGGTRASAASVMLADGFAWHGGRLVAERQARHGRWFELTPGKRARAVSMAGSEHLALPRVHPTLRDVGVFLGWFGRASEPLRALSAAMSAVTKVPGARDALEGVFGRVVKGSTGGPDAAARATGRSVVLAETFDAGRARLPSVRLEGIDAYELTANLLAWGAETAASGGLQGIGALGPVDGFGLDALERGCAEAGIVRVAAAR